MYWPVDTPDTKLPATRYTMASSWIRSSFSYSSAAQTSCFSNLTVSFCWIHGCRRGLSDLFDLSGSGSWGSRPSIPSRGSSHLSWRVQTGLRSWFCAMMAGSPFFEVHRSRLELAWCLWERANLSLGGTWCHRIWEFLRQRHTERDQYSDFKETIRLHASIVSQQSQMTR